MINTLAGGIGDGTSGAGCLFQILVSCDNYTNCQKILFSYVIEKHYSLNDFINFLLLLGPQYCAYHVSHTHVHAVAVSQSFGRSIFIDKDHGI
jgi:hypothetical protein